MTHILDSSLVIKGRLIDRFYLYFIENTDIHQILGGRSLEKAEIEQILDEAIEKHCQNLPPLMNKAEVMQKEFLMELILGH